MWTLNLRKHTNAADDSAAPTYEHFHTCSFRTRAEARSYLDSYVQRTELRILSAAPSRHGVLLRGDVALYSYSIKAA